ncbi:Rho1 guanine nucleotide exchange factor 1 [Hypsizygus marmoreus]|uniref:Rho1 guanine nucleotide exchange factor 1 n=1 Tax=Hypsizygus marmoreus TaxID=39966 RepID=A0A369JDE1_HYPMA|nr:Rho1 guanine nucleotide exchange factor 1 [Hypsizygus marmoreus]
MPDPRPHSPVDEDLQNLYNEVWAGFADETPAAHPEQELDNIYSVYGGDNDHQSRASQPSAPNGRQHYAYGSSPRTAPRSPHDPMITSPKTTSAVRRLPPTPGGSSPKSSPTNANPFSMPEPELYYEASQPSPQRMHHYSTDSYASSTTSNDLLRKATAANAGGRRLPAAPAYMNGSRPSGGRAPGLPSDPRPPPRVLSHASYDSTSSSSAGYSSPPSRESSYRPPGARPPTIPGRYEPDSDMRYVDNRSINSDWSYQKPTDPYQYNPSVSRSSSALGVPAGLHKQPSQEYLGSPVLPALSFTNTGHETSQYTGYVDPQLQRSGSATSSQVGYLTQPTSSADHYYNGEYPSSSTAQLLASNDGYYQPSAEDQKQTLYPDAGPSNLTRNPSDMLRTLADYDQNGPVDIQPEEEGEYWEDEDDEDENRFVNFSLLSHMAVQLRDKVPRGTHVKGSIPYPRAFTGKDIVSTIQSQIQRELAINHGVSTSDRRAALQVARSLQSQLFFYEVEWGSRVLQDGVEDVYMFLGDLEGGSESVPELEELPTGVVTMLTRCYSPSCGDGAPCYSYVCPRKGNSIIGPVSTPVEAPSESKAWTSTVDPEVLKSLPESEINRQTIIHTVISKEEQYVQDLDIVESDFIKPLRMANPPVIQSNVEEFIDEVFGNILDLRECNRRLLEVMYVRQREQAPIIQRIGDIFLDAATEFRLAYPIYIGHHPIAEKRMKDEVDNNPEFRLFLEQCSRQSSRQGESLRLDLKHFLNRPAEHLQKYPVLLEAIHHETAEGNPDADYLVEAIESIKKLQSVAQLRTFQSAMGRGAAGKWEWHDLVSPEIRAGLSKKEAKRQSILFELIKGEMAYVKHLENIENMYIIPLRTLEPPIIPRDRLEQFIQDVFHNFGELYEHHQKLVDKLQEIQREEHPVISTVTAALLDAALNFREAYMEYIPNYPIAAYRIDDEMANNLAFKTFVEAAVRHPDAHRLDMKSFINRPIPRLLRYELLLKGILDETPPGHEDIEAIPQVIDIIKALGKETEPGVFSAKQKVELWRYNSNLVFKPGEAIDMDLLNENRSLIHSGKLLRQPESGLEWNGWSELFVLLFDNYMVMTKPKDRDGVIRYHVNRRPIPLDLLTLVNFTDPPTQRSTGLLRNLRGERHAEGGSAVAAGASPDSANDSRSVFPLTLHHNGRTGGPYILYADSAQTRNEWKQKLEEALGLRKIVQESNKVFEVETLSADTFLVPSMMAGTPPPSWNQDNAFTGKVTCSVPFTTSNGRPLVAIGCAEGVWIGYRHDPKSMRRVLHLKMVTQCAMLEEFGIFLVLADKSLFAYHIEALVPSSPQTIHNASNQVPQKLNGTKDVHFFSVGSLHGRTLIIYMKKKGLESIFRVLEPVGDKINERVKAPIGFGSRLGFRSAKSEWFRVYRDFFLPTESFDLIFLKARIVVLCAKGFEIMDLNDFNSITIPLLEDPRVPLAKRCESCRPMGMFRSKEDEFLLCYDEFGLYVDKHGDPSRSAGTIEWEGTAERVALHSPYVLIFDSRFIEIRHIETGRLAQIIPGNDVRCIYDGRGVNSNIAAAPAKEGTESMVQEAQVHAVMNAVETIPLGGGKTSRVVAQNVVELIPTLPLYPPGSLAPPAAENAYAPRSYFSPPNSPENQRPQFWR